jgi:translation initiation factor 2B subunit (eIF-2B alpha/beta/delta family)
MSAEPPQASEIARLAGDRVSGATALVLRGIDLLRTVCDRPDALQSTARALCRAQPSMAGFRTAAAVALAAAEPDRALMMMAERIRRAPAAIARAAAPLIRLRRTADDALRIVTVSRSAVAEGTVLALAADGSVAVSVGEARPGREGLALADALSARGVDVAVYTDAAIGGAMAAADAFLTGADAVSSTGFVNKAGSAALTALARACGVPIFVLAGREKVLPVDVFDALELRDGDPREVLDIPTSYRIRNPYFERIAADGGETLIVDGAVLLFADVDGRGFWSTAEYESYARSLCA